MGWLTDLFGTSRPQPNPPRLKDLSELKLPEVRTTPSSPEETKLAQSYLRVTEAIVNEALEADDAYTRLGTLIRATRALEKVRDLDPHASITLVDVDGSHDHFAATILFYESRTHFHLGENQEEAGDNFLMGDTKGYDIHRSMDNFNSKKFKHYADALEPAYKAVLYFPRSKRFRRHLYLVYCANYMQDEAKKTLDVLLEQDPYDVETLKLIT